MYCPNCKLQFLDGIETCSECGASLVNELPEGEEVLVPDWDAMDETERSFSAHHEANQLRNAASTVYVKKADKYEDLRSTAVCFTTLGILGIIFAILNFAGVLSIYNSPIQLLAMCIVSFIFTAVGISSYIRSKEIRGQISEEESLTNSIMAWMEAHITQDFLDSIFDASLSEEANFLQQSEEIKQRIQQEYAQAADDYLDTLIDEFFNTHFSS